MWTSIGPLYIKEYSNITQGETVPIDRAHVRGTVTLYDKGEFVVYGQLGTVGRCVQVSPAFATFREAWEEKCKIETRIREVRKREA